MDWSILVKQDLWNETYIQTQLYHIHADMKLKDKTLENWHFLFLLKKITYICEIFPRYKLSWTKTNIFHVFKTQIFVSFLKRFKSCKNSFFALFQIKLFGMLKNHTNLQVTTFEGDKQKSWILSGNFNNVNKKM